jgi:hypothetical protein
MLTGYSARQGVSTGAHDDLFVRALVLESGLRALAMVSVDVLALGADLVCSAAARIAARLPIAAGDILVAATHTHSGPLVLRTFFNGDQTPDPAYLNRLSLAIEHAVVESWRDRFTARLGLGSCQVEGAGVNRRDPAAPVDREAALLRIDDTAGTPRGVLVNYGCHATLLGFDNLLVTADFPGQTVAALEHALGPGAFALFFNGAEGNVSVHHSSELNLLGVPTPGRTFERAAEIGQRVANAVLAVLPSISTEPDPELGVRHQPLEFAGRNFPPATGIYAEIAVSCTRLLQEMGGRVPFPLQALRIGRALFIAAPGELFTETSLELKRRLAGPVFLIGLANGYYGYIPTTAAFAEGGYESSVALCAPDSERRLINAILALAHSRPHPEVTR